MSPWWWVDDGFRPFFRHANTFLIPLTRIRYELRPLGETGQRISFPIDENNTDATTTLTDYKLRIINMHLYAFSMVRVGVRVSNGQFRMMCSTIVYYLRIVHVKCHHGHWHKCLYNRWEIGVIVLDIQFHTAFQW